MPESPETAGWSPSAVTTVPATPAAIPATWVPWKEPGRQSGSRPCAPEPGPGKERATITLGVVNFRPPFGKPAGYEKPAGLKNGFDPSTPSSTTPILIPWPKPPVVAQNVSALITAGLLFVSRW